MRAAREVESRCRQDEAEVCRPIGHCPSRQLIKPLRQPVQTERKPDSLFRRLEDDERRGLGALELAEQLVVHDHLGDAAVGEAADEAGAADVLVTEQGNTLSGAMRT